MKILPKCIVVGLLTLTPGACDDASSPVETVDAPILPGLMEILDQTDGDEVVITKKGDLATELDVDAFSLGVGYIGWIHRPDIVEAWAMLAVEGPEPDCEGSGRKFMKCVKDHLDNGEECELHKDGDTYHAHCEEE